MPTVIFMILDPRLRPRHRVPPASPPDHDAEARAGCPEHEPEDRGEEWVLAAGGSATAKEKFYQPKFCVALARWNVHRDVVKRFHDEDGEAGEEEGDDEEGGGEEEGAGVGLGDCHCRFRE